MQNQNELEELVNSVTKSAEASDTSDKNNEELAELLEATAKEQPSEEVQPPQPVMAEEQPPASEQPSAAEIHKQKMAQIREALAMVNETQENAPEEGSARPSQHEALPPLKRNLPKAVPVRSTAAVKTAAPAGTPNRKPASGMAKTSAKSKAQKAAAVKKSVSAAANPKKSGFKDNLKLPVSAYAGGIGGAVVVSALIGYLVVAGTYQHKFLPNTIVDAVDVAGMTDTEAKLTLLGQKALPDLKLTTPKGETAVFSAEDFDLRYSIPEGSFNEAASENPFSWISKLFNPTEYQIRYDISYSEWKLRDLIDTYDWGDEVSENAVVVRDDTGNFVIQPETLGDQFDTRILLDYVAEQVEMGRTSMNMEDSGCYESYRAEIKEADLEKELDLYRNYANCTITYDFEDRTKVVDSDMIVDWIMLDDDGAVKKNNDGDIIFNYNEISNFVAQMAAETDTWGKDRQFMSTMDGWITVKWDRYSCYGWQIDQEATINQLISLLREGETVTVDPIYTAEGHGYTRATDDIGNTYIDVDISEQHMWVYKEGVMVFEADFVSGTETIADRRTPRGVDRVRLKTTDTILGTMELQGYETHVNYWMPFNYYGCGFHDLSRGAYGGSIYMYNGSHGCLNMSLSNARELYNIVEVNMPVLVHD